jgi:hypothetical protein
MGWESRKGGGRYYTRSRKVGGRVIREYVGTGPIAELTAQLDSKKRLFRIQEQAAMEAECERDRVQEMNLTDYCETVAEIMKETLLAAGYHKHKGQWRLKKWNRKKK